METMEILKVLALILVIIFAIAMKHFWDMYKIASLLAIDASETPTKEREEHCLFGRINSGRTLGRSQNSRKAVRDSYYSIRGRDSSSFYICSILMIPSKNHLFRGGFS